MGWLLTTVVFLSPFWSAPQDPADVLPSRELQLPPAVVQPSEPASFDLLDVREEERQEVRKSRTDGDPHSMFVIKRHIGASMGYDNTVVHGSVGLYLTVAEWGR